MHNPRYTEHDNLDGELYQLQTELATDPVANYRFTLGRSIKSLEFLMFNRERSIPDEISPKIASALAGTTLSPNKRGKVPLMWALENVSRELGMDYETIKERIERAYLIKQQIKQLTKQIENTNREGIMTTQTQDKHVNAQGGQLPATKSQLWYLHILTGEDTRGWTITKQEADTKIKALKGNTQPAPDNEPTSGEFEIAQIITNITNRYQGAELQNIITTMSTELNNFKDSLVGVK